ncbi:CesT family type III secretion system chaperone [Roseiconus lacunae]|uniref:CesT family type III secretion system chaperone n=1 Tax=Roseiconus lacunae TaxID=2605694 RepID=UPI001E4205C2|nr:CesT family type III secretion system chaperone [Roseiconus lacunae]MCD0457883.1 CesT family type III secretion system chaperone [Roseiconus lacunae]
MSAPIFEKIQALLDSDESLEERGMEATFRSREQRLSYLKIDPNGSGLLVCCRVGSLGESFRKEKCDALLRANLDGALTAAGAFGLDQDDRSIYLSRYFPFAGNGGAPTAAQSVVEYLHWMPVATRFVHLIDDLILDDQGAPQIGGLTWDAIDAVAKSPTPFENESEVQSTVPSLEEVITAAGLPLDACQNQYRWRANTEDELFAEIEFDPPANCVWFRCGTPFDADNCDQPMLEHLLQQSCFLQESGNCVIGLGGEDSPILGTLLCAGPLHSSVDVTSIANLANSFLNLSAEQLQKSPTDDQPFETAMKSDSIIQFV